MLRPNSARCCLNSVANTLPMEGAAGNQQGGAPPPMRAVSTCCSQACKASMRHCALAKVRAMSSCSESECPDANACRNESCSRARRPRKNGADEPPSSCSNKNGAMLQPWFSSPIRASAGTRASSKKTCLNSWSPEMLTIDRIWMPGWFSSNIKKLMPCWGLPLLSVRTRQNRWVALWAWVDGAQAFSQTMDL